MSSTDLSKNAFHDWVVSKTDCEVFDVHCETDRDCGAACENTYSVDGKEVTKFSCNQQSGRCARSVYSASSLERAANDLGHIIGIIKKNPKLEEELPESFLWFINHNGGDLFVNKRAAYYDTMHLSIGKLDNVDTLAQGLDKRMASSLREHLLRKLDSILLQIDKVKYEKAKKWILDITQEAGTEEDNKEEEDAKKEDQSLSVSEIVDVLTGTHDPMPLRARGFIQKKIYPLSRDAKKEDQSLSVSEIVDVLTGTHDPMPLRARGFIQKKIYPLSRNELRELALKELFPEETTSPQVLSRQHDVSTREDLCNESMNAGRAESIFSDPDSGEYVATCACLYSEYLTGPACKHKTYRYVIDYDKWKRTGRPEFLTDPVLHFKKAEAVCKSTNPNLRAIYSPDNKGFLCAPVAELVKTALTFRGSHEPSLIVERDINQAENLPSNSFGVNWPYVNLLNRIQDQYT
uniref:Uncharacterized protein n=1 Tax=White spot syndrome virus TaxID=342409 RepID=A0A8E7BZ94_9VIRU|nr:MAG: hypothetical protein OJPGDAPP_00079 [White spot syndrome virus]